jgi:hypothetical protein
VLEYSSVWKHLYYTLAIVIKTYRPNGENTDHVPNATRTAGTGCDERSMRMNDDRLYTTRLNSLVNCSLHLLIKR